ncbi:MAG TPA: HAD family hydrolase [Devosia sp.]|nr:HAD family hydrolase [Devosia sp.]
MAIKNIIFDWDGTLGMTLHLWLAGYQSGMDNQGHEFSETVLARDFFYEHDKGAKKYPHVDFTRLVSDAYNHLEQNLPNLKLYEGAAKTLGHLQSRGLNLALVTSSPRAIARRGMGVHNLEQYFRSLIGGDDGFGHKPHPAPFDETIQRLNASPEETLIIGDARTDILAGQAARTTTCLFTPESNKLFHDFEELGAIGADYTIDRLADLVDLI